MKVLCVAEKPSIAKSITQILSGGRFQTRNSPCRFVKNYDFEYPQTNSFFTVTCVAGHIMECDFTDQHRKWHSCEPFALFDAPTETKVKKDSKDIEKNLRQEARNVDMVMIWTDCDREGENIGAEVVNVCRKVNRGFQVKRARFSAIIAQQIHNAAQHPIALDEAQVAAVDVRIMLDLKIGAAFTRLNTLSLQSRVPSISDSMISYGPCQFPTLGFVVDRWVQVQNFQPEKFWYIYLALMRRSPQGDQEVHFTSRRGHIFDQAVAIALYEYVLENPVAQVTKYDTKPTKKWKPLPLTTVELQKAGSRLLKMTPKKVLDVAEKLYQQGFLSYPRTETDQYDNAFNFMTLIEKQKADSAWGGFATRLEQGGFSTPRKGKNNDKAHPPIHPTAHAGNLTGDEKRVYEFVTRRFLASCSRDAEGLQTTVEVTCGGEDFYATGLTVTARNYLEVYIYDKWSDHELPRFEVGERFDPSVCELRDGETTSPKYLTEADLVTLMDKNGIGTDATIAQHIETIVKREYVLERMEGGTKYLVPSTLGIGLVRGYNDVGLESSLSKPSLRRRTERDMVRICEGTKSKNEMLEEAIEQYKAMFIITRREFAKITDSVKRYVEGLHGPGGGQAGGGGNSGGGGNDDDDSAPDGGRPPGGGRRGGGSGGGARGRRPGRGGGSNAARLGTPVDIPSDDDDAMDPPVPPARKGTSQTSRGVSKAPPPTRSTDHDPIASQSTTPMCHCNIPAVQRTIIKEGSQHKGKKFWRCSKNGEGDCKFWILDEDLRDGGSLQTIPSKRTGSTSADSTHSRQCKCGDAVLRTVSKEGDHTGKSFWACRLKRDEGGCGFFEWTDVESATGRPTGASFASRSADTCYKCNQTGHWASDCPADDQGRSSKRQRTTTSNNTSGVCFKCNQPGHYAPDCPNGTAAQFGSQGRANSSQGEGSGNCFKCNQPGHWSNACPNDGGGGGKSKSRSSFGKSSKDGGSKRGKGSSKTRGKAKKTSKFAEASVLF